MGDFLRIIIHCGPVTITNSVITNTSSQYDTQIMGIDKNGKLIHRDLYSNSVITLDDGVTKLRKTKNGQELLNMGIINTFGSWPGALLENGETTIWSDNASEIHQRTAVGQVNDNNYVIINTIPNKRARITELTELGISLNCNFLFNLDGGGSTQLWMRKNNYIERSYENRKVYNALYFITLE